MAYPRNDQIQYAIIDYLKDDATVLAEFDSSEEIKEDQWQGTTFEYPALRVNLIESKPSNQTQNCSQAAIKLQIEVFTEDDSSRNCDRIAGIICNVLHPQQFTNQSINLALTLENLVPAKRRDEKTWEAQIKMMGTASIG